MGLFNRNTGNLITSNSSGMVASATKRLMEAAGRMVGANAASPERMEQLEKRELLFTMTVTADNVDPNTGIGTVQRYVHYVLPQFFDGNDYPVVDSQDAADDFNDEDFGIIPSGFRLNQSDIVVNHNIVPVGDVFVGGIPLVAETQERFLRVDMNTIGERIEFSPRGFNQDGEQTARLVADSVQIQIRPDAFSPSDTSGLDTNSMVLDIRLNDATVLSFTGAALRRLFFAPDDPATPNDNATNANRGVGTIVINRFDPDTGAALFGAFDAVRIRTIGAFTLGDATALNIDNVNFGINGARFAPKFEENVFGFTAILSGPVGASASFTDILGRPMVADRYLGVPPNGNVSGFDPDDNKTSDVNLGIGAVRFNGVDRRTSFTMWGGFWVGSETESTTADFNAPGGHFTIDSAVLGQYSAFEEIGFGYAVNRTPNGSEVAGLPPGAGSLVIGSPWLTEPIGEFAVPNLSEADPSLSTDINFNRADQGLFVANGQSIGSVNIHGIVHGSSQFTGAVDRLSIGYLVGSVNIEGDAGQVYLGSDAGMWVLDPGFGFSDPGVQADPVYRTGGELRVGRTLGDLSIAGRSLLNVTVLGDINSPATRPPTDTFTYVERETVQGFGAQTEAIAIIRSTIADQNASAAPAALADGLFGGTSQAIVWGTNFYRNDTISSSEFLNRAGTGVRVRGTLSGASPLLGEDRADVFAFVTDGTTEVVIQATTGEEGGGQYFRVVDQNGRTVAAAEQERFNEVERRFVPSIVRFVPEEGAGIYYLVVTDANGSDTGVGEYGYTVVVTGLAPVSFGSYRTGGGSGFSASGAGGDFGQGNTVSVLAGNMGAVRVGVGFGDEGGDDNVAVGIYNSTQTADDSMSFQGGTFVVADGSLYNITAGGDIGSPRNSGSGSVVAINITGDLGSLHTGVHSVIGQSVNEGDVTDFFLTVGGRIGSMFITGGIGVDQDREPGDPRAPTASGLVLRTGTNGGPGDIGILRVGWHWATTGSSITTSNFSTIGAILVSQDAYEDAAESRVGFYPAPLSVTTGFGSDVRFFDVPQMDAENSDDDFIPLIGAGPIELIDDSGGRLFISVTGAEGLGEVGRVRVNAVNGSQGNMIGAIEVDDIQGFDLNIVSDAPAGSGRIGIGRITVRGATAGSQINIQGTAEVDVYRIDVFGERLDEISNTTANGDLLAIDAEAVDRVRVAGNLGITQTTAWGPRTIAPFIGLDAALSSDVRGPVGWVGDASFIDNDFGGGIYRPVNSDVINAGDAFLDDLGSPLDGRLAGLVVRTGFISDIDVGGSVQSVVLQDSGTLTGGGGDGTPQFAPGTIVNMRVNSDGVRTPGGFDGIRGSVFANNINTINIGDGISSRGASPLGIPGIFAQNNITTITTTLSVGLPGEVAAPRTFVGGVIAASNINVDQNLPEDPDGINAIELPGALFDGAYVGMGQLDKFWTSFNYGEERLTRGDINVFNIAGGTLFRTEIDAVDLRSLNIAGGTFDASFVSTTDDIETITAANYRNSTALGQPSEFLPSTIIAAGNIDQISATEDMSDLRIKASGEVRRGIDARDMTRVSVGINNKLTALTARRDIKGSTIETGRLETLSAGRNISSTTINSAGLIQSLTAANEIRNTTIQSTGPNGAITAIAAPAGISGTVRSNGSIGTITSTLGDVNIDLTTIRRDANVGTVTAGRDLALKGEVQGGVTALVAGRNVGKRLEPGALVVRGTVASVSAPNGTLYNDIRAGEGITAVALGGASSKPTSDQVGRGSLISFRAIGTVAITGDFGGDIISHSGGIGTITITNGSLLPGRTIAAYSGSIAALNIVGGSLLGNVYADVDITALSVTDTPAATGTTPAPAVFGDVGINPNRSQNTFVDARRNELPAGVFAKSGFEGALVQAGRDIVAVTVSGGVYESGFAAGRNIGAITIGGVVANNSDLGQKGSFFTAGDRLGALTASGGINDAYIIAGLTNLGADNRPGGIGTNADTVKSGVLGAITAPFTNWVTVVAGVDAGANGVYGDDVLTAFTDEALDDRNALGRSTLENFAVGPDRNNTQYRFEAYGVGGTSTVPQTALLPAFGTVAQPPASGGFSGSRSFNVGSASYTFNLTGGGTAFFNTGTRTLTLDGTTATSTLAISSSNGTLEDLNITTTNNASLAALTFNSRLVGGGAVTVDGGVAALSFTQTGAITSGGVTRRPTITIGGDVTTLTGGSISDGFITANSFGTVTLTGDFGSTAANDASLTALTGIGTVAIGGNLRGLISSDREIGAVTVGATVNGAFVRAGGSIAGLTSTGAMRQSVISAGFNIGPVTIGGEMFDSAISAGADLGRDGFFDGTGVNADKLRTGSVGAVIVRGNFTESDITAGYLRGNDRFFGTVDDRIASGRGSIASVTITGTQVGSGRFSESYRIASNGTIGNVTIAGSASPGTVGNYGLEARELIPETAQVSDLALSVSANVSTAVVTFNQPMDFNSLFNAITVSEVRGVSGEVEVRLVRGTDYTLSYDDRNNQLRITFSRNVTQKDLPQLPGEPGAGLYRIEFDQTIVSGRLAGSRIDGDSNGLIDSEDSFAGELVVGDAGDKLTPARVQATDGTFKDFYGPINLNALFDSDLTPDGLPDPNQSFTVRGFIGDHPDHDSNNFRIQGDVDLYRLTLQAGQILRLGALQGSALRAQTDVLAITGGSARGLPVTSFADDAFAIERAFLIETTGDYVIYVGDPTNIGSNTITNPLPSPGTIGDYRFTVTIFDDGDSGFTSTSDAGDGAVIAASPAPVAFAGADGVFGNADDFSTIDVGEFTFTLGLGADGVFNTADDVVTGNNIERLGVANITSQRLGDGRVETTIESAIGPAGAAGTPATITSDVDVYHLNSRQAITPGTKVRATLRLSGTGSDLGSQTANLGSRTVVNQTQNYNTFSFGLFETSASQSLDDGVLVFAPTDFLPYAGTPNTVLASNGAVTYGYDAAGDFFIDFLMPESQFGIGAGTFAFYVQGVVQTDYTLVFTTDGLADALPEKPRQNFFIETGGGTIDWFQAGGVSTTLAPFNVSALGFNGSLANGQTIAQYVLENLVSDLNALYQNAGLDVFFSTNPSDFEFQQFSTIYLAGNTDPTRSLFDILAAQSTLRIQEIFGDDAFGADLQLSQPFGYSQRSDALNADLEDDAVVFVPSYSLLGYTQSQADIDQFVNSVTASVARRAGELMGARITQRHVNTPAANQVDPFAANSVEIARADMSINNTSRALSLSSASDQNDTVDDTNFFLGRQRALSLLSLGVARR